jgi:dTMP kinase
MTSGLLFVFEGPDGVGKSSMVHAVSEDLRSRGIRHSVLTFPGRDPGTLGKVIYDIHHGSDRFDIETMSEAAKQTLHIAAHLDAIERTIVPRLRAGEHVLLDRYWWSTWVYGLVDGVSSALLEALVHVERIQWGSVVPSLAVLLDRDEPIARDEDMARWQRIRAEYLSLAPAEKARHPVEVVRNTGSAEEVATRVCNLLMHAGICLGERPNASK